MSDHLAVVQAIRTLYGWNPPKQFPLLDMRSGPRVTSISFGSARDPSAKLTMKFPTKDIGQVLKDAEQGSYASQLRRKTLSAGRLL